MEREVGGGIGMGNTCKPMAVSFQCMTKFTTNKKKSKKKSFYLFFFHLISMTTGKVMINYVSGSDRSSNG